MKYWLLLFAMLPGSAIAQLVLYGTVVDEQNGDPIPYVNIGVPGKNLGTLSNEEGKFILEYKEENSKETIVFAMLGYFRKEYQLSSFDSTQVKIVLEPRPVLLDQIKISGKKRFRRQHVGWMKGIKDGTLPTDTTNVGACTVLQMEVREAPFLLDYLLLRITYNNKDTFRLRLRVYDVDPETNEPGEDILNRQIFLTGDRRIGWEKIDLRDKLIVIDKKRFFIGVEWIETRENRIEFVQAMKRWNRWKYHEYLSGNTNAILTDSVRTESEMIYNVEYHGDMRDWPEFDDLPPLTAVGVADDPSKKSKGLVSYERRSSFAPWIRKEWIMGIAIKISY